MTILVTGATGTLGRLVVARLRARGHEVRGLSRQPSSGWHQGDLTTGAGLDAAVAGVSTVIHCASRRHDLAGARNLLAAARRAGSPHVVFISIVGVDRVPLGYYKVKHQVEGLVAEYGGTILRATQFHDLILTLARTLTRLPVAPVPAIDFQPIDADDVAARLIELAEGEPAGRVADLGGPQVRSTADLVHAYLRATGRSRRVVPVRLPGKVFQGYRQGGHLAPAHRSAGEGWEKFLARTLPARAE